MDVVTSGGVGRGCLASVCHFGYSAPASPDSAKSCPVEEVVYMLKISVNIKVTAGAVALLLSVLLRSCG